MRVLPGKINVKKKRFLYFGQCQNDQNRLTTTKSRRTESFVQLNLCDVQVAETLINLCTTKLINRSKF